MIITKGKNQILRVGCLLMIPALLLVASFLPKSARADVLSWASSDDPTFSLDEVQDKAAPPGCSQKQVYLGNDSDASDVCVVERDTWRYGKYTHYICRWGSCSTEKGYAIGYGNDSKMYRITAAPEFYAPYLVSDSNTMVVRDSDYPYYTLGIIKDFQLKLNATTESNGARAYAYNDSEYFKFQRPDGTRVKVQAVGSSENGQWLVAEAPDVGLFRINLETLEAKRFSNTVYTYWTGANPAMEFAVSNDGSYVAAMGVNAGFTMYDITDTCGDVLTDTMSKNTPIASPCAQKDMGNYMPAHITGYSSASKPVFDDDSGRLSSQVLYQSNGTYGTKWVTLTAAGYTPAPKLDYLALGDSYSSGEGDVSWNVGSRVNYYLPGTDVVGDYSQGIPEEKCHISSRAYPFLLAKDMMLSSDRMKSVACSGAGRLDVQGYDVARDTNIYLGQRLDTNKPSRLEGLANISMLQANAKEEFIPGRVQQIEFVKRNKPKAITITMGGNDVGFGDILMACKMGASLAGQTCDQALPEGRATLGKVIRNQYANLRDMYQRLKEASSDSQIFVIGYPRFIDSQSMSVCAENALFTSEERTLMVEGVKYMNTVIKAAASAAGVKYIDIENSLGNHILCGSEESFITGVSNLGITNLVSGKVQEAFHPNARGHNLIFASIKSALGGQTLLNSTICNAVIVCPSISGADMPAVPQYFADPMSIYTRIVAGADMIKKGADDVFNTSSNVLKKSTEFAVKLNPLAGQPTTIVNIELHSDPVPLGTFTVASDGSVNGTVSIPSSVPAGYHTLHVYGATYSGEPIDYYQTVRVEGPDGDVDEDGIPDSTDACNFITPSGVDADLDGTDDACDAEISSSPQLYRVRNGEVTNGEVASYMYVERNTRASSITGVTGDYDPDGNGWSIVATSSGAADSGVPANFWVDTSNVPHVSVRTTENGCVQYTPASLAQVAAGSTGTLQQESTNTATCRAEAANDETDGDGIPDDQQALYRVHNGDSSKGEDSDIVYIERSRAAAEAQLGISDYAPTGNDGILQPWSLLASSQDSSTKGNFKKLIIVDNEPVALVQTGANTCIAVRSASLSFIQQSTQFQRGLVQVQLPEGATCN